MPVREKRSGSPADASVAWAASPGRTVGAGHRALRCAAEIPSPGAKYELVGADGCWLRPYSPATSCSGPDQWTDEGSRRMVAANRPRAGAGTSLGDDEDGRGDYRRASDGA